MLQIFVDNQPLELYTDEKINFTFQCNDIAELKDRQTNYTNAFNIPKTPHNVRIFNGLGLPSDTSSIPYEKPNCVVKYGGIDVISKGWLHITETAEDYKCHIYSGIIDIFKAIGNKTIGELNINLLDHKKTTEKVIQLGEWMNYALADYNGETHFKIGEETVINADPLIPSISTGVIWDAIENNNFGTDAKPVTLRMALMHEDNFLTESVSKDLNGLFITYPKTTELQETEESINITANAISAVWDWMKGGGRLRAEHWFVCFNNEPSKSEEISKLFDLSKYKKIQNYNGTFDNHYGYFRVKKSGVYKIEFDFELTDSFALNMFENFFITHGNFLPYDLTPEEAYVQSVRFGKSFATQDINDKVIVSGSYITNLLEDEYLYFGFKSKKANVIFIDSSLNLTLNINKLSGDEISFTNELKQYAIKDFLKDIFVMYGITIVPVQNLLDGDNFKCFTIEDRLKAKVVDFSKHYIERTSERYIHNNYAQHNAFKWQYNDKEDNHNDGEITINNLNIDLNKDIYASKVYSPEKSLSSFPIGDKVYSLPVLKFYEKEPKEKDGQTVINYKPLDKRFYFLRMQKLTQNFKISSKKADNGKIYEASEIYIANYNGLDWQSLINNNYRLIKSIIENAKIHEIDLDLDFVTASQMRFDRVYYFQQEQQYYLLNKLNFDTDGKAKGEFIRIDNYLSAVATDNTVVIDEIVPPAIGMYRSYGDRLPDYYEGQDNAIELHIDGHGANPTALEWERWKADGTWEVFAQATEPILPVTLAVGKNSYRLKATHGDIVKLSNEVMYQYTQCKEFVFSYAGYEQEHIGEVDYIDCNGEEQRLTLTYDESNGNGYQISLCARKIINHNQYAVDITNYANQNNC